MADPSDSQDANTQSSLDRDPHGDLDNNKDEFEASLEAELNPTAEAADSSAMNVDNPDAASENPLEKELPTLEARLPMKKDASLREFLSKMDDYAPIVSSPSPLWLCLSAH